MPAAQADVLRISAQQDLLSFPHDFALMDARVKRRLAPAPADGLDLFDGICPAQQFTASFKEISLKIGAQPIADHRDVLLIHNVYKPANLLSRQEIRLVHNHAGDIRQVDLIKLLHIAAWRLQPAA